MEEIGLVMLVVMLGDFGREGSIFGGWVIGVVIERVLHVFITVNSEIKGIRLKFGGYFTM